MMFRRLLWKLLRGSRGRLAVALIALTSGASVISGLLNLELDVEHKLTQEFRSLGANVIIDSRSTTQTSNLPAETIALVNESRVASGLTAFKSAQIAASAPYLYIFARIADSRVVVTGTWLDQLRALNPTWKIEGSWIDSRTDETSCLIGRNVARSFHFRPGSQLNLSYPQRARFTVAGILDSGSSEDNQTFVGLSAAQNLAGMPGAANLWQLSVTGNRQQIESVVQRLQSQFPNLEVRPLRDVSQAEGDLLSRIRLLIVGMALLILVLTALCVLATMAALAMERREDVGLMKALGGSISRVVGLFLAEVGVLGAAGGLLGCLAGIALSAWMGRRVFGTAISPRWEVFPFTISLMVGVALAGALPLRLLGKVKPAVILRGE